MLASNSFSRSATALDLAARSVFPDFSCSYFFLSSAKSLALYYLAVNSIYLSCSSASFFNFKSFSCSAFNFSSAAFSSAIFLSASAFSLAYSSILWRAASFSSFSFLSFSSASYLDFFSAATLASASAWICWILAHFIFSNSALLAEIASLVFSETTDWIF